jgi:hypothetical protein
VFRLGTLQTCVLARVHNAILNVESFIFCNITQFWTQLMQKELGLEALGKIPVALKGEQGAAATLELLNAKLQNKPAPERSR